MDKLVLVAEVAADLLLVILLEAALGVGVLVFLDKVLMVQREFQIVVDILEVVVEDLQVLLVEMGIFVAPHIMDLRATVVLMEAGVVGLQLTGVHVIHLVLGLDQVVLSVLYV
jgi:hypothetical protein